MQTTRSGTDSQKQRSHTELTVGRGSRENGGKGTGNKKHNWQVQNRQGEVKNSIGNGGAKELICTTHGHELRWEMQGGGGERGGKNWDNCNSTINKIHLK